MNRDEILFAEFEGQSIKPTCKKAKPGNAVYYDRTFDTFKECELFCEGLNTANSKVKMEDFERITYEPRHKDINAQYKSDWNVLMRVATKVMIYIEKIAAREQTGITNYTQYQMLVNGMTSFDPLILHHKLRAIIQWHNENNKT